MKKIIRLNEEKLQRLVEAYIENLDINFAYADDAKNELMQLITNILSRKGSNQEGHYFLADMEKSSHGGHYIGKIEVRDKLNDLRYSTLVMVDLDLTNHTILYQAQPSTKYAKEVNSWTIEILNKLGYSYQ